MHPNHFAEDRMSDDGGPLHDNDFGIKGINLAVKPSGTGCVECLASGTGWWLHLRRCAECGHIGCCDNSPMKHATAHFHTTHHPITQSFEPGEDWFYDYTKGDMIDVPAGTKLAEPTSHPLNQRVPFTVNVIVKTRRKAA